MKLSTSTNLLFLRPGGMICPLPEAMQLMCEAGFDTLDMNFYDWGTTPGSPYLTENWNEWFERVCEAKDRIGVCFEQAHAYFFDFAAEGLDRNAWLAQQERVVRSIRCASALGAKVVVTHPSTVYGTASMMKDSKECNVRYFNDLLERTRDLNVVIAVENMVDVKTYPKRKYCASPEELADLIDTIHDPRIKICWDFEHGDMMREDQPQVVRMFGERLAATHVSEQHGAYDPDLMHLLPLFGKIRWKPIMDALREINYQGCFSFEAHNYLNVLPDTCIETGLRLAYQVGEYLMAL